MLNNTDKWQSYDGGIADEPFHEPHAGYTFCSIGALAFIKRLKLSNADEDGLLISPSEPERTVHWLVSRQTELTDPDAGLDSEFRSLRGTVPGNGDDSFAQPAVQDPRVSTAGSIFDLIVDGAGMNGRTNKVADTCYAWWAGATLHTMGRPNTYNQEGARRYLLGKTQHPVLGGFGKFPGDLPDLYHSYLALAALGLQEDGDVEEADGGMCISKEARGRLPDLWKSWQVDGR
jgi:geranylgeranyl transferase type-1 subunit beta